MKVASDDLTDAFPSSTTSGLHSPEGVGQRHIRFDNKVEQCIAVDFKHGGDGMASSASWTQAASEEDEDEDDDDDEEYMPMLKTRSKKHFPTPSSSRSSFSQESKGIVMLPSTTLKFHDDPDCQGHPSSPFPSSSWRPTGTLSHSNSQETLKPSKPSSNFLLADDDDADMYWEPFGSSVNAKRDSIAVARDKDVRDLQDYQDEDKPGPGMRRTPSGMFMPYDENEEQSFASTGMLGRLVDTVNTAKDIATVVWNVGWRK